MSFPCTIAWGSDAGPFSLLFRLELQSGIDERLLSRRHAEEDEIIDAALLFLLHPLIGIERAVGPVADHDGHLRQKDRMVEDGRRLRVELLGAVGVVALLESVVLDLLEGVEIDRELPVAAVRAGKDPVFDRMPPCELAQVIADPVGIGPEIMGPVIVNQDPRLVIMIIGVAGDVPATVGELFIDFANIGAGLRILGAPQHGHDANAQFATCFPLDADHLFGERDDLLDSFRRNVIGQLGQHRQCSG